MGVYQVSCGPIPMKLGGNRPGPIPNLPVRSKKQYLSRKTTITTFKLFIFFADMFFLFLSLKLVDLARFQGTNRYIWTWRSCFCYPFLRKMLILDEEIRISNSEKIRYYIYFSPPVGVGLLHFKKKSTPSHLTPSFPRCLLSSSLSVNMSIQMPIKMSIEMSIKMSIEMSIKMTMEMSAENPILGTQRYLWRKWTKMTNKCEPRTQF